MPVSPFARSLPFVLAAALLAAPAMAQTAAGGRDAVDPPADAVKGHPAVEKRISALRAKLKITPDESKAFDDFAQIMRDNANRMDGLVKDQTDSIDTKTAVDQMKSYQAMATAHADDMQRLVPAFSRLYDELSPVQKKEADESFRNFGRPASRKG